MIAHNLFCLVIATTTSIMVVTVVSSDSGMPRTCHRLLAHLVIDSSLQINYATVCYHTDHIPHLLLEYPYALSRSLHETELLSLAQLP